jgi:hypothetical protein
LTSKRHPTSWVEEKRGMSTPEDDSQHDQAPSRATSRSRWTVEGTGEDMC